MAAIALSLPILFGSGQLDEPEVLALPNSGTIADGDIVFVANPGSTGQFKTCATNPAKAAGLALHASGAIFNAGTAPNGGPPLSRTTPFGSSQAATALQPQWEATMTHAALFRNNQQLEINLRTGVALAQSLIGNATLGGFFLDTNNIFTFDPAGAAANVQCVGFASGPNKGVIGDTAARVIVVVAPSATQI